jgi:hypothetical protein
VNLVGSMQTLVSTFGSGQGVLIVWLCLLALATLVFLVMLRLTLGVYSGRRRDRRTGADHPGAAMHHQQFFFGPPQNDNHRQETRPPYERR